MEDTLQTPDSLREDIELLKEWLSKQPHLPKVTDEEWLVKFLRTNKYSLERTKLKLDNYFSRRTKYPEVLKNRDPTSLEISQGFASFKIAFGDKMTANNELLTFAQPQHTSKLDMKNVIKVAFMMADATILRNTCHQHILWVVDFQFMSYTYFLKAFPWVKLGADVYFNAYSERMKAIHLINAPTRLEKAVNALKGLFPKKIAERFYVHPTKVDLCKLVDEDVLCSDFGGKGPSLDVCLKLTRNWLEEHREWYLKQDELCSNEALRPKTNSKIEDMQGSFRKLEID